MNKLRLLDLFSGIGGFSLGLERTGGFETVAFCEYAEFPRKVLAKHWPNVPIYPDVRELTAERLHADGLGRIDIICGGYPCQPFSYAGKRNGAEDDRHLWPEMRRLVETLRPAWVIGENVAGHITMGLDDVLADLDGLGYATQAFVIPACAVNAPHRRDRTWVVAYGPRIQCDEQHDDTREQLGRRPSWSSEFGNCDGAETLANSNSARLKQGDEALAGRSSEQSDCRRLQSRENVSHANHQGPQGWVSHGIARSEGWQEPGDGCAAERGLEWCGSRDEQWTVEPAVGRVAYGISGRVDRLKALGNAVVPQIPELIGRAILKSMEAA